MDKNEILQKSRQENREKDFFDLEVINKGSNIAMRVGILMCCVFAILSAILMDGNSWIVSIMPCWTIYFSMLGSLFVYKFIKRRKKHELTVGIVYIIIAALMFARFILYIIGVWC